MPDLETLHVEANAADPKILLVVRNSAGEVVRRLEGPTKAGFHRVGWDLRYPDFEPVTLETPTDLPPWFSPPVGPKVVPGRFSVELTEITHADGEARSRRLGTLQELEVRRIFESSLPDQDPAEVLSFQLSTGRLYTTAVGTSRELARAIDRLHHLEQAAIQTPGAELSLPGDVRKLIQRVADLQRQLVGDSVLQRLQEPTPPSIVGRIRTVIGGHWDARSGPTGTHREAIAIATQQLGELLPVAKSLVENELPELENRVAESGAPWTPGRALPGQ